MKLKSLSLICIVALSSPLVAVSQESPDPSAVRAQQNSTKPQPESGKGKMDPATLGRLDAVLTVCAEADAANSATYKRLRMEMIVFGEGTQNEMRVEGSDTPEYKEAYAATVEATDKASKEDLAGQCIRMIGAHVAKKN